MDTFAMDAALARQLGLDGSLWFDNVEQAMLKLAEPEYAEQSVYGYVRGTEVVRYVREIQDRYRLYVRHFRLLEEREAPVSERRQTGSEAGL